MARARTCGAKQAAAAHEDARVVQRDSRAGGVSQRQ
jgi:hypothetical protein